MAQDDWDGLNCQLVLDPNWRNISIALIDPQKARPVTVEQVGS